MQERRDGVSPFPRRCDYLVLAAARNHSSPCMQWNPVFAFGPQNLPIHSALRLPSSAGTRTRIAVPRLVVRYEMNWNTLVLRFSLIVIRSPSSVTVPVSFSRTVLLFARPTYE